MMTNLALDTGGRFYVDHAHPEYSTPECLGPLSAVAADGQLRGICEVALEACPQPYALYAANTDGKGATWGHHENYRIDRDVDFADLASLLLGHLISRQIFCGAGRVGIGTTGNVPGYQISARADYLESVTGLQTTFNRPLINTRDEPHDLSHYRRLHLIAGDANNVAYSTYLRVYSTSLVLWALIRHLRAGGGLTDLGLIPADPIRANLEISHDTTLKTRIDTASGDSLTAIALSRRYLQLVSEQWRRFREDRPHLPLDRVTEVESALRDWGQVLTDLETDVDTARDRVEWVAKLHLLRRYRNRLRGGWDDPRLQALDLQWGEVSPRSAYRKLAVSGAFRNPPRPREVELSPRAVRRAELVRKQAAHQVGWRWAKVRDGGTDRWLDLGGATGESGDFEPGA